MRLRLASMLMMSPSSTPKWQSAEGLEAAASTLSPQGLWMARYEPFHVPIWWSLAEAYVAAGEPQHAAPLWRRIIASTDERLNHPIEYVRSFYRLAEHSASQGEDEAASDLYRRFLDHWQDGDLDRDLVAAAQRFLEERVTIR